MPATVATSVCRWPFANVLRWPRFFVETLWVFCCSSLFCLLGILGGTAGCSSVQPDVVRPENLRHWAPDQSKLSQATFNGDSVHVSNIRNCRYVTADDYVLDYYDHTFDLNEIRTVDFIVCPFQDNAAIAHTMLSFGFADGRHIVVSVEIRKEDGEAYHALKGFARQYELQYVVVDERDILPLCAKHLETDTYLYRTMATPAQARKLFVDVMQRANQLADNPEFYHTVTNNCTTNIARHVNRIWPGKIPYGMGVLLPGKSDRLAYDLGLIATQVPFEEAKKQARVNDRVERFADAPDFSALIRR